MFLVFFPPYCARVYSTLLCDIPCLVSLLVRMCVFLLVVLCSPAYYVPCLLFPPTAYVCISSCCVMFLILFPPSAHVLFHLVVLWPLSCFPLTARVCIPPFLCYVPYLVSPLVRMCVFFLVVLCSLSCFPPSAHVCIPPCYVMFPVVLRILLVLFQIFSTLKALSEKCKRMLQYIIVLLTFRMPFPSFASNDVGSSRPPP
jgi:hypothetical protein